MNAEALSGRAGEDAKSRSQARLLSIAVLAWFFAIAVVYGPLLERLWRNWQADENYSHGFLVGPIAAVLAWRQRDRLRAAARRPAAAGLFIVLASLVLFLVGSLGAELFTARVSLVGVLAGTIVYVWGWPRFRIVAFPVAFLLFMIPLPTIVFDPLTASLQLVASDFGERLLRVADVLVFRDGNVLTLSTITLSVTEACSRIPSLMSLLTITTLSAFLFEPTLVRRIALMAAAVPLAIGLNALRVAATGIAASRYGPEMAKGLIHEASGWAIFLCALLGIAMLHRAMRVIARSAPAVVPEVA